MPFWQRFGLSNLVIGAALFSAAIAGDSERAVWLALVQIVCGVIGFLFAAASPSRDGEK